MNIESIVKLCDSCQHRGHTWICECGKTVCMDCDHSTVVSGYGRVSWTLCNPDDVVDYKRRFERE